jgi:phosphatidylinositol alpha-1,6-mannosyltransferase
MEKPSAAPSPKRLDIAIVTLYYPPLLGGLESYLERLAEAVGRRARVAVLAPRVEGCALYDRERPTEVLRRRMFAPPIFRNDRLVLPLSPFIAAAAFFWTLVALGRRRPMLICSGSADFALPIALAARLLGARFAFICHGKDGHVRPGVLPRLLKRLPMNGAMRLARAVFANSRFTATLLDPAGRFADKIRILPTPIEPIRSPPTESELARARAAIWGDAALGPLVLSVGRLREHKGFQHAIAAFAGIARDFPDARYAIVGEGSFESELRNEARRLGVADRVVFAGMHRPADPFYALATIFVTVTWPAPGEPEGFGMVFLEAARFGVPSIAGNIGGMVEAVIDGETGLTVEPADPSAIASAMRRLLSDAALRERLGAAARDRAAEFAPDRVAEIFMKASADSAD